ncbi:MAG: DUF2238 domain-containing protein [Pseudomonadales bacterium]|jgi:putative membrane protein|nr:DUF2238 domain-containing protein [Pseudomonadales bacterium]MCP5333716.1 DUF2238 domain-containing protein [Pseudomonadales bacterium]HMU90720.1 DUF2238 domain-containing protein [Pseudomonadales bacterium]HMW15531.1 DUF2238 domain-containing protein [Pseudomonadales bacterium]HMW83827.1 DUF2238 domain-containing protein [Pseudomonadales bacterium]
MTFLLRHERSLLLLATLLVLLGSGWQPHDRATWWLEVAPVLIALPILLATHHRHPLTPLLYRLLFLHGVILMVGGHYTYARVPLGFWFADWFDLTRNHYDRLGHLAQGFVPALLAREILLRATPLRGAGWIWLLVTAVALAVSALYELLEWAVALISAEAAESFLAMQGDVWDTQWDIFLALIGALLAQWLCGRQHDRELARLRQRSITNPSPQSAPEKH